MEIIFFINIKNFNTFQYLFSTYTNTNIIICPSFPLYLPYCQDKIIILHKLLIRISVAKVQNFFAIYEKKNIEVRSHPLWNTCLSGMNLNKNYCMILILFIGFTVSRSNIDLKLIYLKMLEKKI